MITALATILLYASVTPGRHDLGFLTADELATRCNATSAPDISYCYAFIAGVHDAMKAYEVWLNLKEFCPPSDVMQADLRRIILGYLSAYPGVGKGQAASAVVLALKTAYPCTAEDLPPTAPSTQSHRTPDPN